MKKWLLFLCCAALLVSLAACGNKPDTSDSSAGGDSSQVTDATGGAQTPEGPDGGSDSTTSTTGNNPTINGTTATGSRPIVNDNIVDAGAWFEDEPTTTAPTTGGNSGDSTTATTTTTAKPTTIVTTTLAPEVIEKVKLPAEGSDLEDYAAKPQQKRRGRIKVSAVDLKDGKMTIKVKNYSTNWITQETFHLLR